MYQEEIGASGTHHFQGYIECTSPVKCTSFNYELEGAHFEKAQGTAAQCVEYCTKEDTRIGGPYVWGTPRGGQGTRTDVIALRDAVRNGVRGRELFDNDATVGAAVRFTRAVDRMVECYSTNIERTDITVTFHYGPSGTGKTFCAHEEGAYYFDGNNGFFNGYKEERTIILDEFGGHCLTPLMFQRLCDKYPFMCNTKGGSVPCRADNIHICSNYLPSQWWSEKTRFNQQAVYRRITVVHYHDKYKHYFVYKNDDAGLAMEKLAAKLSSSPNVINVIK